MEPYAAVQIQTIDACNSRCVMCPHKSVAHSGRAMEPALFERVVAQLAQEVAAGRIIERLAVFLFFQNEPLLDAQLFERAAALRRALPRANLVCFTNGLLLPGRAQELIESELDTLWLSLYGEDARSFNQVTGLRVDQARVDAIRGAATAVKRAGRQETVIMSAWREDGQGGRVLYDFSSRAGFYTGQLLHGRVAGCRPRRDRWLHVHADGDMVLCCMDWRRETLVGNIGAAPLAEILASGAYGALRERVSGRASSADDFICKRCEWAVAGEPPAVT